MNDFLPKGYETPETPSNFMELEEGLNSFRILSSAIVGYEWWTENSDGQRKPVRVRTVGEVPAEAQNATDNRHKVRHFWAFVVYNYTTNSVQVLVVKQQTIMRAIEALVRNEKWGNPMRYDLIVEKSKTGTRDWDVEYSVIPESPAELDPGIAELAKQVPVRLEALYEGKDPFASENGKSEKAKKTGLSEKRMSREHAYS